MRAAARRLSTRTGAAAAAAVETAAAEEGPSRFMQITGATGVGTMVASIAAWQLTSRFSFEPEFREYMRRDQPQLASLVEETLLPEYAPAAWALHMRVEDCLLYTSPSPRDS